MKTYGLFAKSGQSPDYKVEHFITASSIHSVGTRFMETRWFSILKVNSSRLKSLGYNCYALWNELPVLKCVLSKLDF